MPWNGYRSNLPAIETSSPYTLYRVVHEKPPMGLEETRRHACSKNRFAWRVAWRNNCGRRPAPKQSRPVRRRASQPWPRKERVRAPSNGCGGNMHQPCGYVQHPMQFATWAREIIFVMESFEMVAISSTYAYGRRCPLVFTSSDAAQFCKTAIGV